MSKTVYLSAQATIDVPFHDCDPMQVVWHGNYARYFEVARCELLRKISYDYLDMQASGYVWPIVDMRTKYIGSAVFTQKIIVTAELVEYESRLKINYVICCAASGKKLTKGYTVQVAIDIATEEMLYVTPAVLQDKIHQLSVSDHDLV
ncbi:MAG: acyl-CoA thioesterase [Cognaticolwellia sp.]